MKHIRALILSMSFLATSGCAVNFTTVQTDGASRSASVETRFHSVSNVDKPVEILVDRWGVSHIYAGSVEDAFFAQGYNVAKDRLWQIALWRRRGLGNLSEVFGSDYLQHDIAARHLLYRGAMDQEWASYGDDAKSKVEAFVNGVNAYIDLIRKNEAKLPTEFVSAGFMPESWRPEDVVKIRIHALVSNLGSEVSRAQTVCKYGLDADRIKSKLEPEHSTKIPAGLDVCSVPEDVLELYNYAHLPLSSLPPERVASPKKQLANLGDFTHMQGSNSWVISGEKSATGRPVLASDPHRLLEVPSSRYLVHMSAPGLNVIGAGEPFAPGISIGHNDDISYGLTFFYSDQEDLYVYETNPENPNQYRYNDNWENFEIIEERVQVSGATEEEIVLRFTRHGPVIHLDRKTNKAFAVRAAKLGSGGSPYLGSLRLMQAKSWDDFTDAMGHWRVPTLNMMYADIRGEIGWKPTGLSPRRTNWDGLLPVPGDGRYEWSGFTPVSKLLGEKSPKRGWIATANHMNLPSPCDGEACAVGFEWAPPFRFERIAEELSSNERIPFSVSEELQADNKISFAQDIVDLTKEIENRLGEQLGDETAEALGFLNAWDAAADARSMQTGFFMLWYQDHLAPTIAEALTAARSSERAPFNPDVMVVRDVLSQTSLTDINGNEISRDQLLVSTLTAAYKDMIKKHGENREAWRWGNMNTVRLEPFTVPGAERKAIDDCKPTQGVAAGGSRWSVNLAIPSKEDPTKVAFGPSVRLVLDVGDWDNSRAVNMPGQSGDHDSPHFCDLFEHWAEGATFPLLFSRRAIEKELSQRIILSNEP